MYLTKVAPPVFRYARMLFAQPPIAFALAVGLLAAAMNSNVLLAKDVDPQADGHDQAAMTEKKIAETIANLPATDRKLVEAQRFCPVMEYSRLGVMGAPVSVTVEGKVVFVCCKACTDDAVVRLSQFANFSCECIQILLL